MTHVGLLPPSIDVLVSSPVCPAGLGPMTLPQQGAPSGSSSLHLGDPRPVLPPVPIGQDCSAPGTEGCSGRRRREPLPLPLPLPFWNQGPAPWNSPLCLRGEPRTRVCLPQRGILNHSANIYLYGLIRPWLQPSEAVASRGRLASGYRRTDGHWAAVGSWRGMCLSRDSRSGPCCAVGLGFLGKNLFMDRLRFYGCGMGGEDGSVTVSSSPSCGRATGAPACPFGRGAG